EFAETGLDKLEPPARRRGKRLASANGRGIAVDRDHPCAALDERARIAAGAERGVDIEAAGPRIERLDRFSQQDRNMAGLRGRGAGAHHPPAPGNACASRSARKRRTRSRAESRWA